jgi:hypothetical protein
MIVSSVKSLSDIVNLQGLGFCSSETFKRIRLRLVTYLRFGLLSAANLTLFVFEGDSDGLIGEEATDFFAVDFLAGFVCLVSTSFGSKSCF